MHVAPCLLGIIACKYFSDIRRVIPSLNLLVTRGWYQTLQNASQPLALLRSTCDRPTSPAFSRPSCWPFSPSPGHRDWLFSLQDVPDGIENSAELWERP